MAWEIHIEYPSTNKSLSILVGLPRVIRSQVDEPSSGWRGRDARGADKKPKRIIRSHSSEDAEEGKGLGEKALADTRRLLRWWAEQKQRLDEELKNLAEGAN
jgi:hypothetical protein